MFIGEAMPAGRERRRVVSVVSDDASNNRDSQRLGFFLLPDAAGN
jgi:hypothetical protein